MTESNNKNKGILYTKRPSEKRKALMHNKGPVTFKTTTLKVPVSKTRKSENKENENGKK